MSTPPNTSIPIPGEETLILRHPIVLAHHIAKSALLLTIGGCLLAFTYKYHSSFPSGFLPLMLSPLAILLVNYALIKLILSIVNYGNKLVIITDDKIIIIDSTLLLQEDIEVLDIQKIVKIDVIRHGLFAALCKYGHIVVEQHRNEVRTIHCVRHPYALAEVIRKRSARAVEE